MTGSANTSLASAAMGEILQLRAPDEIGGMPLNLAIGRRRSMREFAALALTIDEIGQLLWAAQGITEATGGLRAAPSAGALYPIELDAVMATGVFRYRPLDHSLLQRDTRDLRSALAKAALGQDCVAGAPCLIAISAVAARTSAKYGGRATRYVLLEAGHVAQNILLEACTLGLAAVPVGAFDDGAVARVLRNSPDEQPLYLIPVGAPRASG